MAINPKIAVIGCGVVGALIAYELSRQFSKADITVLDRQQPAQGSTGAALGVLMGVISSRVKGRTWRLREASIRRYPSLIAELAEQGYSVPFNSQGIISLCFDSDKLPRWETLREKRGAQGWPLEIWSPEQLQARCPHVDIVNRNDAQPVKAAIYSPADGQVHPAALTRALVAAAESRGVTFDWSAEVTGLNRTGDRCTAVQTTQRYIEADWVVLTAGLGSAAIAHTAPQPASEPLVLIPVLGQAMEIQLPAVLGNPDFQPVINGDDIHLVPLGEGRYWLGATVEFPPDGEMPIAAEAELEKVKRGGERFVGAIAHAKILSTWSGLRPRPVGQPAPVIKPLGGIENVILATGHYRNGVLLAPATAQRVCERLAALRIV
ncbi:MAG: FAD-dependent oxidoreductase [Phormidesmis sp.]